MGDQPAGGAVSQIETQPVDGRVLFAKAKQLHARAAEALSLDPEQVAGIQINITKDERTTTGEFTEIGLRRTIGSLSLEGYAIRVTTGEFDDKARFNGADTYLFVREYDEVSEGTNETEPGRAQKASAWLIERADAAFSKVERGSSVMLPFQIARLP